MRFSLCILIIAVTGQTLAAQQQMARNITAEITEADLNSAYDLVRVCLTENAPNSIHQHDAIASDGHEFLTVVFDENEEDEGRSVRYVARLDREKKNDAWKISELQMHGEQQLPNRDEPISFTGNVKREALLDVYEHTRKFLVRSDIGRVKLTHIVSNEPLQLYCESAHPISPPARIIYSVAAISIDAPSHVTTDGENTAGISIASSGTNGFIVWLARDSAPNLVTTDVNCIGGDDSCDPTMLAKLRQNLEAPSDPVEEATRMAAAMAVVPDAFQSADVTSSSFAMAGLMEMFVVIIGDTQVGDSRHASSMVNCFRPAGSDDDWVCQHQIISMTQKVGGQALPIQLANFAVSESELEQLVRELKRQLTEDPAVYASGGPITIHHIRAAQDELAGTFMTKQSYYDFTFDYDAMPKLKSVSFRKELKIDWPTTEQ